MVPGSLYIVVAMECHALSGFLFFLFNPTQQSVGIALCPKKCERDPPSLSTDWLESERVDLNILPQVRSLPKGREILNFTSLLLSCSLRIRLLSYFKHFIEKSYHHPHVLSAVEESDEGAEMAKEYYQA